jgi:predicted DNA-binding transcriptional regulator YafY
MYAARLSRCLQLLNMLQSRIGYDTKSLANALDVSPRTIYRDLCLLAEVGIPVFYDVKRRGHLLKDHFNLRLSHLTKNDLIALLLAAHIFSLSCLPEISRPIQQAISKLMVQVPTTLRKDIANLLNSIGGKPSPSLWPHGSQPAIAEILSAIRQKRHIRVTYHSEEESIPSLHTKITPQRLVAASGRWYLVGRSSWHRKIFRFDLRHIRYAEQIQDCPDAVDSPLRPTQREKR